MAFSLGGILAVVLEFLRPVLLPIAIVILADVAALAWLAYRPGGTAWSRGVRPAALAGGVIAVVAILVAPGWTQASLADLTGALDWLAVIALGLGVGIAAGILLYPLIQLALRATAARHG